MKSYLTAASLLVLGLAATPALAQGSAELDEVIVTGTRSTSRTVTTSLAPIDVLSSEVMAKSGKQSTRDLISTLVPSANTSNSGAGASFAIKTVSLRGLGGDQTLVLVNGKRRHNTAILFVNGESRVLPRAQAFAASFLCGQGSPAVARRIASNAALLALVVDLLRAGVLAFSPMDATSTRPGRRLRP